MKNIWEAFIEEDLKVYTFSLIFMGIILYAGYSLVETKEKENTSPIELMMYFTTGEASN